MPTTQPLDEDELGDIAEGRLKPIAAFANPDTPVSGAPPRAEVKQAAASVATGQVSSSQAASRGGVTPNLRMAGLRQPSVGLKGNPSVRKSGVEEAAKTTAGTVRTPAADKAYEAEDVAKAWMEFVNINKSERLLTNAMRVALPQRIEGDLFNVAQSEVHLGYIRENLSRITDFVRTKVGNGKILFQLETLSEDNPMAWNDRQLLEHMAEENPALTRFISRLNLKLS